MATEYCPERLYGGVMGCRLTVRIQGGRERHDLVVQKDWKKRSYSYPTCNHACIGVFGNLERNRDPLEMWFEIYQGRELEMEGIEYHVQLVIEIRPKAYRLVFLG